MEAGIAAGLHCPWFRWSCPKARPPFPGRFRPRPCSPGRSLRFLDPGILLFRFGFLRVPRPALRPASVPWRVPSFFRLAASKRSFPVGLDEAKLLRVLSRFLPPGGFGFRRTLEGKWVRPWLAPLPRASSFRLPGPRFLRLLSEDFRRSPLGRRRDRLFRFRKRPLPCDKSTLAPTFESRLTVNRRRGLWITGISGVTWIKLGFAVMPAKAGIPAGEKHVALHPPGPQPPVGRRACIGPRAPP
jgi:hypothetical protein